MGKMAVCDKCKKLYDYVPETKFEGGTTYITVICNKCGYVKKTNVSHIHYGDDAIKK